MWLLALLACTGTDAPDDGELPCTGCASDADTDTDGDTDTDTDGDTDTDDTGEIPIPEHPPRVVLFIGDGMGFEHVAGGGLYAYGEAGSLVMETLPNKGRILTASLTGVTDSAAAGTALSTGVKTWNGVVGMDRDAVPVQNLLELARTRGMAVGVVTTDALSGATPSAFFAHTPSRSEYEDISRQLIDSPPDVALGGGIAATDPPLDVDTFQVVQTRTELLAAVPDGRPFMGFFSGATFPYVADTYEEQPTLAEMTRFALDLLDDEPHGFFLMVEGARIDHASHANDGARVHQETAAFDEGIAAALDWATEAEMEPTLVVTADHECGGLRVSGGGTPGELPVSDWRWGQHTNADVPVYASGPFTELFDGQRLDDRWVHAVLEAAVLGADAVVAPVEGYLVDGRTTELGDPISTQSWDTNFGAGYNQLDALRVTADVEGLRVGVDGVFEVGENAVFLLVDVDFGAGTGFGADATLGDEEGVLDAVLSGLPYGVGVDGLGFDLALAALGGEEIGYGDLSEVAGLRGLGAPWGGGDDLWWLLAITNFDYGNLAMDSAAADAGATGATENGWETFIPWTSLYPDGMPEEGLSMALVAVTSNRDGDRASNQALPPLSTGDDPGDSPAMIGSVVRIDVDGSGGVVGEPTVFP